MEQPHSTTAQRKWKQLTEKDRYRLEAYFNAGLKTQEIANRMGYSKRTIERERKLGLTPQLKPATKDIKTCGEIQTKLFYLADVAQRRHEERSANKGRNLKSKKRNGLPQLFWGILSNKGGRSPPTSASKPYTTILTETSFLVSATKTCGKKRRQRNEVTVKCEKSHGITVSDKALKNVQNM